MNHLAAFFGLASTATCLAFLPAASYAQVPTSGAWAVRTVDRTSGEPLSDVLVAFPEYSTTRLTNREGLATSEGTSSRVRIVARRLGYADLDTIVAVPPAGSIAELQLERTAISLPALTVQVDRQITSRQLHRLIFDREVAVGAVGVTQAEIKAVPALAEPDVFRSLQALAGVTSVNDYTGELFVRGGGSDQVAVLLDGAPVFAPYHMYGYFGSFNADVVESTEFYRGAIPARHGGTLSGVVSAHQRAGGPGGVNLSGGLSLLGGRLAADGTLPWAGVRWLAAGRKAFVDLARINVPYSFHDLNLGIEAYPAEEHRLRWSIFASDDYYAWDFQSGGVGHESFSAKWANLTSSASWSWVRDNRTTSNVTAYYSRYRARQAFGGTPTDPSTTNRIAVAGLRAGVTLRGERTGGRAGVAVEGGPVRLQSFGEGAAFTGNLSRSYLHASAFAEMEAWLGPVRFAPGIRAGLERRSKRSFFEPRFSVRLRTPLFAISASVDRTYQFLSVLRDAYAREPGAPTWFVHAEDQPVSVADGASLALDAWRGQDWTASIAGWIRRFRGLPHWRAGVARDPRTMEFHDGNAYGVDLMVQKHAGPVRGWLSYQWASVALDRAEGEEYRPHWDRRHEVEGLVVADLPGGFGVSLRATVGTGGPFWYPAGDYTNQRFDPHQRRGGSTSKEGALLTTGDFFTVWSDLQGRLPTYARFDVAANYAFRWGAWEIAPYLSVVNVTGRTNVLFYQFAGFGHALDDANGPYVFEHEQQLPFLPTIGIDFKF